MQFEPQIAKRLAAQSRVAAPIALAAICITLLVIIVVTSWNNFKFAHEALKTVRINYEQTIRLQYLLRVMLDAETGTRGYLLTRNERYLEPLQNTETVITPLLTTLSEIYPEGHPRHEAFERLKALISAERNLLLSAVRAGELPETAASGEEGQDKLTMDAIRASIRELRGNQETATKRLTDEATQRLKNSEQILTALAVGVLGFIVVLFAFQQRESSLRAEVARLLADENSRLEANVARRTRELSGLASYLTNAREDERARLARELHDELGALLTAAIMDARWLQRGLPEGTEDSTRNRYQRLIDSIGAGIKVKRRIIDDLRPPLLQGLGLIEALRALAETFAAEVNLKVVLPDRDVNLVEEQSLALYRIAQESLTNIRKYAGAANVEIGLVEDGETVRLWIEDDGKGFDPESPKLSRHGLAGIQHRVLMYRGQLTIRSAPGQGTRIEAAMPAHHVTPAANA